MDYITPPEQQTASSTTSSTFSIEAGNLQDTSSWWASDRDAQDGEPASNAVASGAVQAPLQEQQQQQQQQQNNNANNRRSSATAGGAKTSVSVACISCRSKHLKCDGGVRCSRCQAYNLVCSYIKSRRGFKGPRRVRIQPAILPEPILPHPPPSAMLPSPTPSNHSHRSDSVKSIDMYPTGDAAAVASLPTPDLSLFSRVLAGTGDIGPESTDIMQVAPGVPRSILTPKNVATNGPKSMAGNLGDLAAFFTYYHPAHPFLPPLDRFQRLISTRKLVHVCLAMRYVGSGFITGMRSKSREEAVERSLFQLSPPQDGFTVWAMLLYGLGLHASANAAKAFQVLQTAIDLALSIGMHRREFAVNYGEGCRVLEESWRRTYWELYVVDGMFAAVTQRNSFRLHTSPTDVPLPCEESEYHSGQIPTSRTLDEYDGSIFDTEETVFSSFTYRIAAIRNLGKVLPVTDGDALDQQAINFADHSIVNWSLHLPACKRDPVTRDGRLDEMLFQAHMVCLGSTILLHRPRSYLSCKEVKEVTICVSPDQSLLPSQAYETHTARAIRAAEEISKLVTLPVALKRHSPFFTCVVTMSSVVHLAYWSFFVAEGEDSLVKEQIRLNIGALKTYAEMWPVAKCVLCQVRGVAQEMFASKKRESMNYVDYVIGEELLRGMIEEDVANTMAVASSVPIATL